MRKRKLSEVISDFEHTKIATLSILYVLDSKEINIVIAQTDRPDKLLNGSEFNFTKKNADKTAVWRIQSPKKFISFCIEKAVGFPVLQSKLSGIDEKMITDLKISWNNY
jgi:hypothetical protein